MVAYHDDEWGIPVHDDVELFERLALESFQAGLSWSTILSKREAFRSAFRGFDPEVVAAFGPEDRARLMADAGIVRNRLKIQATIDNARAVLGLRDAGTSLPELVWSHRPDPDRPAPTGWGDVPALTPESTALAKALKREGFRFVGPTTAYASMQACGLVNDHLAGCIARAATEAAQRAT
jgi:DNA-3-methyladenine glycosylase I